MHTVSDQKLEAGRPGSETRSIWSLFVCLSRFVNTVAFHPDGNCIGGGTTDSVVKVCVTVCVMNESCVQNCSSGSVVWSISQQVWDIRMNKLLQYYQGWTSPSLPLIPRFPSSFPKLAFFLPSSPFYSSLRGCKLSVLPPNWQLLPVSSQWQHTQGWWSPRREGERIEVLTATLIL